MDDSTKTIIEQVVTFILGLAQGYPITASILMVVGALKLLMTPIMKAIDAYVYITPTQTDNELWKKVKESKYFTAFLFILDLLTSIKLPLKK